MSSTLLTIERHYAGIAEADVLYDGKFSHAALDNAIEAWDEADGVSKHYGVKAIRARSNRTVKIASWNRSGHLIVRRSNR